MDTRRSCWKPWWTVHALTELRIPRPIIASHYATLPKGQPFSDFDLFCAAEMDVDSEQMCRVVALDGERVELSMPLHFRVHPQALRIMMPTIERREIAA